MDFLIARFLDGNTYEPSMAGSTTYMAPRVRKVLIESASLPTHDPHAPLFVDLLGSSQPNVVCIEEPCETVSHATGESTPLFEPEAQPEPLKTPTKAAKRRRRRKRS